MVPVSIAEAAERLGVSIDEIRNRIRRGELEARHVSTPQWIGMGVLLPGDPSEETTPEIQTVTSPDLGQAQPTPGPIAGTPTESSSRLGPAPLLQGSGMDAAPPVQPPPSPFAEPPLASPTETPQVPEVEAVPPPGPVAEPAMRNPFDVWPTAAPPVSEPEAPPPPPVSQPVTMPAATPPVSETETVPPPAPVAEPAMRNPFEVGPAAAPPVSEPQPPLSPAVEPQVESPTATPRVPGAETFPPPPPVTEPPSASPFGAGPVATPPVFETEVLAPEETPQTPISAAPAEDLQSSLSYGFDPAVVDPEQATLPQMDAQEPAPEPPRRRAQRGSPLRDLVATLKRQVDSQRDELESRRREVQELHVLLQQLQTRALPPPPEPKRSFWQGLWRKQ